MAVRPPRVGPNVRFCPDLVTSMALRHGRGPHSARLETWQHASYVLQSHDDLMMRIDGCGRQRQVRVDLFILYTELSFSHQSCLFHRSNHWTPIDVNSNSNTPPRVPSTQLVHTHLGISRHLDAWIESFSDNCSPSSAKRLPTGCSLSSDTGLDRNVTTDGPTTKNRPSCRVEMMSKIDLGPTSDMFTDQSV